MAQLAGFTLAATLFSASAWAHAFGQRYDLPLPLSLYLWSAGFVVAVSFIIAALFLRSGELGARRRARDISHSLFARILNAAPVRVVFKLFSVCLLLLILISGLSGEQDPSENFAPIFIWVIWWVGLAYIAAFIGNVWDGVNPWRVLHDALTIVLPRWRDSVFDYPGRLASWPALLLFLIFAYLEFISGVAQQPATLAWLVIGYSFITLTGMRLFGAETWLRHGEAFTVVFGLMARFGVFHGKGHKLQLRLPGAGLLSEQPVSLSLMAFILLMLTTVSFDGFIETPFWSALNTSIYTALMSYQTIAASLAPQIVQQIILSVALLLFYLLFISVYLGFSALTCRLSHTETNVIVTARAYVLSLVPIAIAYHLAHYLSYLLLAGQLVVPILSDPFALGWNLFGTANYKIDISVIDAQDVWYLSVCAIVIGHIAAVCIAHVTSLSREPRVRAAIISQLPMLVWMIAYTMISLWILSQPIIA
jgi:hypothetical protein